MARESEQQQPEQRGSSSLAKAVLAAIVELPSHGWEITKRLNGRMAPTWSFDRRRVYEVLNQLEAEGLAWSEAVHDAQAPGGMKRVFHPTARGYVVCSTWLQAGGQPPAKTAKSAESIEPVWEEIQAWMLLSRPEEAAAILGRLDEWEQDCMTKVEASKEPAARSRSWDDRMLSQHRASIREKHLWRLRCISVARKEIEEYLAQQQ